MPHTLTPRRSTAPAYNKSLLAHAPRRAAVIGAIAASIAASCTDWPAQTSPGFRQLEVTVVGSGLDAPVHVTAPPGDTRLFVVEHGGTIRIIENGTVRAQPFFDLSAEVSTVGAERGMFSLAFHPQYAVNGRFFVTYTGNDGAIHLASGRADPANPSAALQSSFRDLLTIPTPGVQHYGGMLSFTPEGKLLMSTGDGGSYGDPIGEAQSPESLLGKILRLDVDGGEPYAIPADNPFAGVEFARGEIWAMGLRNPWRFSIDPLARRLYVADVGDYLFEEVNIVPLDQPGLNFGWNIYEGGSCQLNGDFCTQTSFHAPEIEYTHQPPCTSITGGIVYRGTQFPEHQGRYFYADYCLGWIRSVRYEGGLVTEQLDWATSIPSERIVSFGEDGAKELYAVSLEGRIFRIGRERE